MIPTCEPDISPDDIRAVVLALAAGHAAVGPEVQAFEEAVAEKVGISHAVATASGSSALHVALRALGIGPGDKVLVPTLTFIATAAAVVHCGATPVFVDSERETWGMDPQHVRSVLSIVEDQRRHRDPKAVIATHLYGHPCHIRALRDICDRAGIPLIEDACEALGASPIGLGDVTCLSFNHNKIITTGGGGMALTRDAEVAARMRALVAQARADDVEYTHSGVGYNYRLSAFQAALGLSQLSRLEDFGASKWETYNHYREALPEAEPQCYRKGCGAAPYPWMPAFLLDRPAAPVIEALLARGIGARPVWFPLHQQPCFPGPHADCPVADNLHRRGIILPCSATITPQERQEVVAALRAALASGTGPPAGPS